MMKKFNPLMGARKKSLALAIATISAAVIYSPGSFAQDDVGEIEEITVTGTRIRVTDGMATPTPVTTITPDELTNFEPGGTVAEQLDALPQFFGTATAQRGSGALFSTAGGSFLNMRSLGANRTLVLLDGSRVVPAEKRGSVNVDTFPTALIRSVDVVTGGASAAYGADALGGVTNFVIDREFQGLKIETGTGVTELGDGERWNTSIAGGIQIGDRLNVIGSIDAMHINEITRDPEDLDSGYFQRWGTVQSPTYVRGQQTPSNPRYITLPWVHSTTHSPTGLISRTGGALDGMKFTKDGTDITPFVAGDVIGTNNQSGGPEAVIANKAFGGAPSGREVEGRSFFVGAQYEFSESLTGFAQIMAGRSESNSAPSRGGYSLQDNWYTTIMRDNAYLPDSVAAIMDAEGLDQFRMSKLGTFLDTPEIGSNQRTHNVLSTNSWSVGFDAVLPNGWDVRASWQSGESDKLSQVYGKIRVDRMFLGMDAVRDPDSGAIVCRVQLYDPTPAELAASPSVQGRVDSRTNTKAQEGDSAGSPLLSPIGLDNTVRDCVPYNVMGNGNMSQAAIDYTGSLKKGVGHIEQDFAELLVTGELYQGFGYGPLSMAAGLTWREQSFSDNAQPQSVDSLGPPLNAPELGIRGIPSAYEAGSPNLHQFSTVPNIGGKYDVFEYFAELQMPFWESDSGEQRLGGSAAARRSDYNTTGTIDSWKLGLEAQVFEDLRLRFTKSLDVREATFSERFDAQGGGGEIQDDRRGETYQITSVSGGNPNLRPEIANTLVAGLVYEPSFVQGLQVSADWYEVDISDAVSRLGLQRIVDECYENNVLCENITIDPATGLIGRVFNYYLNVAQSYVEGIDLEVQYRMEPNLFDSELESFTVRALAGKLLTRSNTPLGGTPTESQGGVGTPELTANVSVNYSVGPYSLQLQGRHIDSTLISTRAGRQESDGYIDNNAVPSSTWWNGRLGYNGELNSGGTYTVALNVQNLFNKLPPRQPRYSSRSGAQSTSSNYDTLGRRYALSFNVNF
jgi:iron complex outermembrane receptor protein